MKRFAAAILAGVAMSLTLASVAEAKDKVIGVSWSNFQEERWKIDEASLVVVEVVVEPAVLPNQPPVASLAASVSTITLPCPPDMHSRGGACPTAASSTVLIS